MRTEEGITEKFETNMGVRQGCALSAALFDIYIDDLEKGWERREEGETNIGRVKIKALKYADDIAVIAESAEMKKMLKPMERYVDENKMTVNTRKTKIVVFRNGGRRKREEEWEFKGEKIEVVNEYKYLGYWCTSRNSHERHKREMAEKAQKAANATWGLCKRAGRGKKKRDCT